ncbi:hypothetical protein FLO80_21620 [Aquicoccus porphyridii]|uniref:Uncharacterized protein n=1 Tax=Aquicoccus porphyridii TaxID=1852029 RepID=A0A5A9YX55_9RHOB|nr:hypothetical protein [Aquicoccus porphyridii]KAA0909426.1 hypothetical protein FLO80_21620 [Aquicoccus porphyridii]RAI51766.1 hypothetical protein DOO74_21500 [Rhodobacteraceae bacterium AsT-22]
MAKIIGVFRNVVFLGWLVAILFATTVTAGLWAAKMTLTVGTMSATAGATALAHRKQLAKAVARTKAKARLRRAIVAIPVAGLGAIAYFEEQDYQEWREDNPEGTRQQYACEVASLTAEVVDEVLQDLPEVVRPSPSTVLAKLPTCD